MTDTSKPRGKERVAPRPKTFTSLKKVILEDREKRYNELKQSSNEETLPIKDHKEQEPTSDEGSSDSSDEISDDDKPTDNSQDTSRRFEELSKIPKLPNTEMPRNFCKQIITPELNDTVMKLIADLLRFYHRAKEANPLKAKRRIVSGLRETLRAVERNKTKCVIMAPNIDQVATPGGLDDFVNTIIQTCKAHRVPVVFALKKKTLGKALGKKMKASCVGILNIDGAFDTFQTMLKLAEQGKAQFKNGKPSDKQPNQPVEHKKKRHRSHKKKTKAEPQASRSFELSTVKPLQGQWAAKSPDIIPEQHDVAATSESVTHL